MQAERPITVACTLLSAVLVIPGALDLYNHANASPAGYLFAGGVIGILSVLMGTLMGLSYSARTVRTAMQTLWALIAIALTGVMLFAAWRSPLLLWKGLYVVTATLAVAAYAYAMLKAERG